MLWLDSFVCVTWLIHFSPILRLLFECNYECLCICVMHGGGHVSQRARNQKCFWQNARKKTKTKMNMFMKPNRITACRLEGKRKRLACTPRVHYICGEFARVDKFTCVCGMTDFSLMPCLRILAFAVSSHGCTGSYVLHDSFIFLCMPGLRPALKFLICGEFARVDACRCATWLISFVFKPCLHPVFMFLTCGEFARVDEFVCVTWLIQFASTSRSHPALGFLICGGFALVHEFICVTWLIKFSFTPSLRPALIFRIYTEFAKVDEFIRVTHSILTPVAGPILGPYSTNSTHESDSKNGHISRFYFVPNPSNLVGTDFQSRRNIWPELEHL